MSAIHRARRLRRLVEHHGLTHADLSHLTGCSRRCVRHWLVDPYCDDHRPPTEQALRLVELQATDYIRSKEA